MSVAVQQSAPAPVPPSNLEAEESVLGACLLSGDALSVAVEMLRPEDFYLPAAAEAFRIAVNNYAGGIPFDVVTLADELARRAKLEEFGGKPYLFTLISAVPTPGSVGHYARIVRDNATLRRLADAAHRIGEIAYSAPEDVGGAVETAEGLVGSVARRDGCNDVVLLRDGLAESMVHIEAAYERGSGIIGAPTGFLDLDDLLTGLHPSNLIISAARPSQGKTALAMAIAQHAAQATGAPSLVFSLEMSTDELVQRLLCMEGRVDSNALRKGHLHDTDWPKLSLALGRLAEIPLYIDDTPNITILEMRAKCRRLAATAGLGLVVIDYLQLMAPVKRSDNRVQEVSEISRSLKILARELNVPVLANCQLSRNVEYRADKRPMLADLRESGQIEADADVVWSLYRDEIYNLQSPDKGTAEINVLKQRGGPIGMVQLGFVAHWTKFVNLVQGQLS